MMKIATIPATQASQRALAVSAVDVAALAHANPVVAVSKRSM